MLDEQLLKCLECRLLASPPKFNLPPPPPPPALLNSLLKDNVYDGFNNMKFLKKCLRMKHFLNGFTQQKSNTANSMPLGNEKIVNLKQQQQQNYWLFTSPETLYMFFFICTILFLVVLIIAIVFLFKLFKIKKELGQSKNKNLSNSLTTSDTASSVSSSNTINSQLLSLKQENDSQFYNQLFANINTNNSQQRVYNQYLQSLPIKPEQNLDEYAEIASQLYEKSVQYTSYEAAYLEKLRLSNANLTVSQASTVSNQGRNSGAYLLTNNNSNKQNGLLMMNQMYPNDFKQQQQQVNTYYVC